MTSDATPNDFLDRFAGECRRLGIHDAAVVLAISGGADSTALLRCCGKLRDELRIDIVVGHVNHQLRGDASDADEAWVIGLCRQLDLRCRSTRIDVAAKSAEQKSGIEETARRVRYDFLQTLAEETGSRFLLTAHTADDQAETVLHHIVRGTGIGGLQGIADAKPLTAQLTLARPLRSFWRRELLGFLAVLRQDFREDASNADLGMTRNRIRHSLLPMLETEFNADVKAALCRLGAHAAEVHDTLAELADRWFASAIEAVTPTSCRIDCAACAEIPPLILREGLIALWHRQQWPRQNMGADEWHMLERMILQATPPAKSLPGAVHAERRGSRLILQRRAGSVSSLS